ncbi:MAG: helix-turn-helix domain-containing protein [Leptolyngbyaceae cyanobacterium bins.302]|nr:helix-turn-helix domain-containing protein [Leptolyngbyaceae cyanobacterium bins.302]
MNIGASKFVQQVEAMSDRLNNLYQEIGFNPSSTLVSKALKELGVASERLQIAAGLLHQQNEQILSADRATAAAQENYQELLEFIPDAYLCTDASGKIQTINQATARLFNLPPALLKRRSLASFVVPDQRSTFESDLQRLQQRPWKQEWQLCLQPSATASVVVKALVKTSQSATTEPMLRWLLRPLSRQEWGINLEQSHNNNQLDYPIELYNKGETIPFEPHIIWQVHSGIVKLTTFLESGQEVVIGLVGPSAPFGSSLTTLPLYEAKALMNTELWRIPANEFTVCSQLQQRLLPQLSQRLQQAEMLLAIHGQQRVADRLVSLLELLKQEVGESVPEGTRLKIRLTHEDLAATCCTTRVTITRLINQLQQLNKLIVDSNHHLIIRE